MPQIDGFFSLTPREVWPRHRAPLRPPERGFPGLLDFLGVSQTTVPGKTLDWAPRPSAMPLVTAGQQPVFADDRTAFDALSQTNLDLRQVVFLPLAARGSISATQQTAARVLDARFANQSISFQTEAPAASLVVISQTHYPAWKAYVDGRRRSGAPTTPSRPSKCRRAAPGQAGLRGQDVLLRRAPVVPGFSRPSWPGLWLRGRNADRPGRA